jgi:hypothetical protein
LNKDFYLIEQLHIDFVDVYICSKLIDFAFVNFVFEYFLTLILQEFDNILSVHVMLKYHIFLAISLFVREF